MELWSRLLRVLFRLDVAYIGVDVRLSSVDPQGVLPVSVNTQIHHLFLRANDHSEHPLHSLANPNRRSLQSSSSESTLALYSHVP